MVFNLVLALTFFASAAFFWRRVSRRLPDLRVIPEEAIARRLHHGTPRWYAAALRCRKLAEPRALKDFGAKFAGKILQRFHIILMRLDNGVVELTRRVRGANGVSVNGPVEDEKPAPAAEMRIAQAPPQESALPAPRRIRKRPIARDIAPRARRTGETHRDG